MENYKDKISVRSDSPNELFDRLTVSKNGYGFGFNLYDRKLKMNLLFARTKEQCENGIVLLKESVDDFNSFKESIKDEEIVTNKILISKDKYGDVTYSIPTLKTLYKVSLLILERKIENGYLTKWNLPEDLDFTKEDIEKLPKFCRSQALEMLENHSRHIIEYNDHNFDCENAKSAILTGNGALALSICYSRKGHEYEEFSIVDPITVK